MVTLKCSFTWVSLNFNLKKFLIVFFPSFPYTGCFLWLASFKILPRVNFWSKLNQIVRNYSVIVLALYKDQLVHWFWVFWSEKRRCEMYENDLFFFTISLKFMIWGLLSDIYYSNCRFFYMGWYLRSFSF